MVIGMGHFMAPWIVCCTYLYIHQWVDGCKGYLVYIPHIPQSVPPTMGPQVQGLGLFVTYSSYTPVTSNLKHVYGCFWSDPIPQNCRVF